MFFEKLIFCCIFFKSNINKDQHGCKLNYLRMLSFCVFQDGKKISSIDFLFSIVKQQLGNCCSFFSINYCWFNVHNNNKNYCPIWKICDKKTASAKKEIDGRRQNGRIAAKKSRGLLQVFPLVGFPVVPLLTFLQRRPSDVLRPHRFTTPFCPGQIHYGYKYKYRYKYRYKNRYKYTYKYK